MDVVENHSRMSNDSCYESDLDDVSFLNRSSDDAGAGRAGRQAPAAGDAIGAAAGGVVMRVDTSPVVSYHEAMLHGGGGGGGGGARAQPRVDAELSDAELNVRNCSARVKLPRAPLRSALRRPQDVRHHIDLDYSENAAARQMAHEAADFNVVSQQHALTNDVRHQAPNGHNMSVDCYKDYYDMTPRDQSASMVFYNQTSRSNREAYVHERQRSADYYDNCNDVGVVKPAERRRRSRHGDTQQQQRRGAVVRSRSAHDGRRQRRVAFDLQEDTVIDDAASGEQDSGLEQSLEKRLQLQQHQLEQSCTGQGHSYQNRHHNNAHTSSSVYVSNARDRRVQGQPERSQGHVNWLLNRDESLLRSTPQPHLQDASYAAASSPRPVNLHDAEFDYVRAGSYPLPVLSAPQSRSPAVQPQSLVSREGSPSLVSRPPPPPLPPQLPKRGVKFSERCSPIVARLRSGELPPREGSPGPAGILKRRSKYFDRHDDNDDNHKRKARLYRQQSAEQINSHLTSSATSTGATTGPLSHTDHTQPAMMTSLPCSCLECIESQREQSTELCDDLRQVSLGSANCDTHRPDASGSSYQYSYSESLSYDASYEQLGSVAVAASVDYYNIDGPISRSSPKFDETDVDPMSMPAYTAANDDMAGGYAEYDDVDLALDVQSNREQLLSKSRSCLGCMMLRQYNFGKGTVFGIFAKPANGYMSPTSFDSTVMTSSSRSTPCFDDMMTRSDSDVLDYEAVTQRLSCRQHAAAAVCEHGNSVECSVSYDDLQRYMVLNQQAVAPAKQHIKFGRKVLLRRKVSACRIENVAYGCAWMLVGHDFINPRSCDLRARCDHHISPWTISLPVRSVLFDQMSAG